MKMKWGLFGLWEGKPGELGAGKRCATDQKGGQG